MIIISIIQRGTETVSANEGITGDSCDASLQGRQVSQSVRPARDHQESGAVHERPERRQALGGGGEREECSSLGWTYRESTQ